MSMVDDIETVRAKFLKSYASVPDKLRDEIISIIGDKSYSWNSSYVEVLGKSKLGDEILETLQKLGMFEDG